MKMRGRGVLTLSLSVELTALALVVLFATGAEWVRDVKLIVVVVSLMGVEILADYLSRYRLGRKPPKRLDKFADKMFSVIVMVVCVAADYVFVTMSTDPSARIWYSQWHPLTLGALGWAAIIEIMDIGQHVIRAKQGRRLFPPLRVAVSAIMATMREKDDEHWPYADKSPRRRRTDRLPVEEIVEEVVEKMPEVVDGEAKN